MKACAALLMLILLGVFGISIAGVMQNMGVDTGDEPTPPPITAILDDYFTADATVIPAGGCVVLSWSKPGATAVYLQPGNGPIGYQEAVDPVDSRMVCPSAAANYVPNIPVDYTLTATYPDGTTTTEVITVTYNSMISTFTPTPTAAALPVDDSYFIADTTVIPAGGCVNLAWSKPGASEVYLHGSNWDTGAQQLVDRVGTTTICPSASLNYVPGRPVDYVLTAYSPDGNITTNIITITYLENMPATLTPTPTPLPLPVTPVSIVPSNTAVHVISGVHFQNFEHGFMLQLPGATCVYAFNTDTNQILMPNPGMGYNYCTPSDGLPEVPITNVPNGLIAPTGIFGQVWANYAIIRDSLGYATARDIYYDGIMPPMENTLGGGPFNMPVVTLPDGRQLYCGSRAATAGSCGLSLLLD